MHLYKASIINLKSLNIFLKSIEPFNLVNLVQIHLILNHSVPGLKDILLTVITIDFLGYWSTILISLYFCNSAVSLKFLEDLLSRENFLYRGINLGFLITIEDVGYCLEFVVDYEEVALIIT